MDAGSEHNTPNLSGILLDHCQRTCNFPVIQHVRTYILTTSCRFRTWKISAILSRTWTSQVYYVLINTKLNRDQFLDEVNVHGRTSRTYCQRRALYICIRFVFMLSMYMMLPAIAWRTFHDAPYTPSTKHQWKLPNFVSIHTCVVSVNVTALCCATISLPASVLDLLEILVHNTMCLEAF